MHVTNVMIPGNHALTQLGNTGHLRTTRDVHQNNHNCVLHIVI